MVVVAQSFPCKQTSCTEHVTYVPDPVDAVAKNAGTTASKTTGAYLTCAVGHTFRYDVTVDNA